MAFTKWFAACVACPRSALSVLCTVHHADGVSTVAVDQRNPTNLQSIGRFVFRLLQPDGAIVVSSLAVHMVMVDAIK